MLIRVLIFVFIGLNFSSHSQDTLAKDSCVFYMPNNITPDCEPYGCQYLTFYLNCELEEFEILVFNKWGEIVYESTDRDELWDPYTIFKETTVLTWQVSGKVLRNGEFQLVKWNGYLTFLI